MGLVCTNKRRVFRNPPFSSGAHKLSSIIIFSDVPRNTAKRSVNDRPKRLIKIKISNNRIREVDAILRNVTETGAGIELQTELEPGEKVLITIKNLEPFFGTVAWSKQHRAGLEWLMLMAGEMIGALVCSPKMKSSRGYFG